MTSRFVQSKPSMLCTVVCSTLALLAMLTAPVAAVGQSGLGGKPAQPRADNPRSQSIFVHELQPGAVTSDAVEVINSTNTTKHVLVYAVDSQVSSGGAFACAQAADKATAVGTWVRLAQTEITLEAAAKQVVPFTITVPEDVSPGEHNGCIVIQDTEQQRAPNNNGIILSMRSAIRLAITVPGDIHKGLTFSGLRTESKDDKKVLLSTDLRNSGNVSLDTHLSLKLQYILGATASTAGGNFPVLSGSSAHFNFEVRRPFWGGWYRVQAVARYNNSPSSSIGEGEPTASVQRSAWVYIAPQPAAAALEGALLVVLGASAAFVIRRRLGRQRIMRHGTRHTVAAGEDLRTIAEQYGMSWKLLARINALKAPYQLKPGQRLAVSGTGRSVSSRGPKSPRSRK